MESFVLEIVFFKKHWWNLFYQLLNEGNINNQGCWDERKLSWEHINGRKETLTLLFIIIIIIDIERR